MRACWVFMLWLVAFMPTGLHAADAVPAPILLEDPRQRVSLDHRSRWWIDTARLTIDQVEAAGDTLPWSTREPGRQYRLDDRALWVQFDAVARGNGRWFLELGASGIDRAQLFYRDASGQWVVQEAGDTKAVNDWPLPGRVPTFELASQPGRQVRYWLRVEHGLVDFAAPMTIAGQADLLSDREREQFLLGGYFGLACLIGLVAIANAIAYRDRGFGAYALYVVTLGLGQAAYLGVGSQHLWAESLAWNAMAPILVPSISAAAGLWFVKVVTEPARFSRNLDHVAWGLIALMLAAAALDAFLRSRASVALLSVMLLILMIAVVALIVYVWLRGDEADIKLIALGFLPVVVMAAFPILRTLNVIPNSTLTRYGVSIGAALEMPILFYAMSIRGIRRREAQVRASTLMHNDALTGLANRATLLQRLDDALARARGQRQQCALLGITISNMDAIAAEYGREVLDRVLVVTASHLRRCTSDIDLAARVAPHDFALLIEGPTSGLAAVSRAQQVVASGLRQAEALPAGLTIKFHVAALLLPDEGQDGSASVARVLEGLHSIPADARKLIRPLNF